VALVNKIKPCQKYHLEALWSTWLQQPCGGSDPQCDCLLLDFITVAVTDSPLGNTAFPNVYVHMQADTYIGRYTYGKHSRKLLHMQHAAGRELANADIGEYLL